jgi:hypothetical protein
MVSRPVVVVGRGSESGIVALVPSDYYLYQMLRENIGGCKVKDVCKA